MLKYKITHTTKYVYSEPVPVCHNQVHLAPRDLAHQKCTEFALLLNPPPPNRENRLDYFGNQVDYFSILEPHLGLTVTASSLIEVQPATVPAPKTTPAWEEVRDAVRKVVTRDDVQRLQFAYPSYHVPHLPELAEYAARSFPPNRPVLEAAVDLTRRLHQDFRYDPKATTITSSLSEVLEGRAGVCQDFAHLEIGCLRAIGLPARYVSGYLRTLPPPGKPRLIGADASHAWLALWCGSVGWVDLDPTNNTIPTVDHITLAWGRDYADVCPIQGVVIGGGQHLMSVSVDVATVDG
jgi:transglutaminase-like putative cysteine protease